MRPGEPAGKYMTERSSRTKARERVRARLAVALRAAITGRESSTPTSACESLTPTAGTLIGIKVLRTFNERIRVAGAQRKLMTRAVRVRVMIASPIYTPFPVAIEQTFHTIAVKGQWKWILERGRVRVLQRGNVPVLLRTASARLGSWRRPS